MTMPVRCMLPAALALAMAWSGTPAVLAEPDAAAAGEHAGHAGVGALSIIGATVPEAPGGNAAAYLTIANEGRESDWITAASSDVSASVEFHSMEMVDGAMQMRPMEVVLPPGASLKFEPGGSHVMLIGLTKPLRAGDAVTLKLTFERHGEITVPITVTPRKEEGGHDHH